MFLMLTLLSVMLAWKYNQRNRILSATKQVRLAGGEVVYRSQNPTVVKKTKAFMSAYSQKPIPVSRVRDGKPVIEYVMQTYMATLQHPMLVDDLQTAGSSQTQNTILRFLSNSDIFVDAVRLPESNVDKKLVAALRGLDGLRIVQIRRDKQYFRVLVSHPSQRQVTAERKRTRLAELSRPFEDAKSIIDEQLPHVQVIDGVLE